MTAEQLLAARQTHPEAFASTLSMPLALDALAGFSAMPTKERVEIRWRIELDSQVLEFYRADQIDHWMTRASPAPAPAPATKRSFSFLCTRAYAPPTAVPPPARRRRPSGVLLRDHYERAPTGAMEQLGPCGKRLSIHGAGSRPEHGRQAVDRFDRAGHTLL